MSAPALLDILPDDSPQTAAARIAFQPDAVLFLLGSFDVALAANVRSVCGRAIIPVALLANALIVDDGLAAGLAAEMGNAAEEAEQSPDLLGLLDAGAATPDPHHSLLMRLPAAWADPAKSKLQMLAALASPSSAGPRQVAAVLFGGGDADTLAILRCARRGWPILAVKGTGGLADALLAAVAPPPDGQPPVSIADPALAEIASIATVCPLPIDGSADNLKSLLLAPLRQPVEVLADAWSRFDDLDRAAGEKQGRFYRIQWWTLALAVAATLLAVAISGHAIPQPAKAWILGSWLAPLWHVIGFLLHPLLIMVPITISVLAGFNSRFREGNKWILLRAAAESVKREIFRYRARAGAYSEEQCRETSAQSKLAASLQEISSNLAQSEVNRSSLPHQQVDDQARLTLLSAEQFLVARVEDQRAYFVKTTAKLYKRLRRLQLWVLVAGGLGTLLAAIKLDVWVALTTALATALTTKIETDQVENSLVQYNVALTNLNNIKSWWTALTPWEKTRRKNIDLLVDQTEKTLERETAGWVQQMQSALDKLTEKQTDADAPSKPVAKS
jgi:hypothetical protein